jgi:hypothetical protein
MARSSLFFSSQSLDYDVPYSCIFNGSNEYSHRTPSTAGDRKTYTFSSFLLRNSVGSEQWFFSTDQSGSDYVAFSLTASNNIRIRLYISSTVYDIITTATYSSTVNWYNIVIVIDTTQSTAADRVTLYVDESEVTSFSSASYPPLNANTEVNSTELHSIGRRSSGISYYNGKMAETYLIDGSALDPTYFSSGGKPIAYTGPTSGQNTFKQDYSNSSSLGEDALNSNDYTTVNMDSSNQSTDTPTS